MYLAKTPILLQWLYPSLRWHQARNEKKLYLSFDDGPIPEITPWVLAELDKVGAKATFFCIGDNVRKHPEIFQLLKEKGHRIGGHTFNHLNGWQTATEQYLNNIKDCDHYFQTDLFRPPYGRIKRSQVSAVQQLPQHYQIIMWDVLSGDFDQKISPTTCLHNVLKNAQNGSIIVFHDSLKAEKNLRYTLPIALSYWKEHGYSFATL